ncbi:hypothetical protein GJU41_21340 [Bacillus idriensis]|uniref:Uncharacterized protein n=1 Tax=Metabacillus idriensis TaxID=324768 RepID=A0A6I2MHF0_9BACI|nr:TnsD family Tn7-like transposition protein [Metabacillus idriensis]MRX56496.1 hypothetical protein [Metabacillus idriensis]
MVTFFPTPYKDELLYSVIARYQRWSCNKDEHTISDLYGDTESINQGYFFLMNSCLSKLSNKLKKFEYPSKNILLNNHTMFKYYNAFYIIENQQLLKEVIYGKNSFSIKQFIKNNEIDILGGYRIKYCNLCFEEERGKGEAYWHISHNLPGVYFCLRHNEILCYGPVFSNLHRYVAASNENCFPYEKIDLQNNQDLLLKVAKESILLMNIEIDQKSITDNYIQLLWNRGYFKKNGKLKIKILRRDFKDYLGEELILLLNIPLRKLETNIKNILERSKPVHTLYHILFLLFLDSSVQHLKNISRVPLKKILFNCLNTNCYRNTHEITKDIKWNLVRYGDIHQILLLEGSYCCICECEYLITLDLEVVEISKYSETLRDKLYHLAYIDDYSLLEISSVLNIDYLTIRSQLSIPFKCELVNMSDIKKHRQQYKGETEDIYVNDNMEKVRSWLERNDKEFFRSNQLCHFQSYSLI